MSNRTGNLTNYHSHSLYCDETCAQVKGKVVLTFLVNRDGRPFHIKVKKSLCESSDKEAIRLVQEGPDWTYGNKQAEVTVKFD